MKVRLYYCPVCCRIDKLSDMAMAGYDYDCVDCGLMNLSQYKEIESDEHMHEVKLARSRWIKNNNKQ